MQSMEFRRHGIPCEFDLLGRSLKSQMREADRQNAKFVLIVGETELQQKQVSMKNMKTGEQSNIMIKDLMDYFQHGGGKDETGKTG
jgi:histidyl-tRNA synthetase